MGLLAKLVGKITGNEPQTREKPSTANYRGVQIIPCAEGSCRAARILSGQHFLAYEIPKLPLDQCDAAECLCQYKLFDDRRVSERKSYLSANE